jgi:hypothetical protein
VRKVEKSPQHGNFLKETSYYAAFTCCKRGSLMYDPKSGGYNVMTWPSEVMKSYKALQASIPKDLTQGDAVQDHTHKKRITKHLHDLIEASDGYHSHEHYPLWMLGCAQGYSALGKCDKAVKYGGVAFDNWPPYDPMNHSSAVHVKYFAMMRLGKTKEATEFLERVVEHPLFAEYPEAKRNEIGRAVLNGRCFQLLEKVLVATKPHLLKKTCFHCFKTFERELQRCARCKGVYYCSKSCSKDDWSFHKLHCVPPPKRELLEEIVASFTNPDAKEDAILPPLPTREDIVRVFGIDYAKETPYKKPFYGPPRNSREEYDDLVKESLTQRITEGEKSQEILDMIRLTLQDRYGSPFDSACDLTRIDDYSHLIRNFNLDEIKKYLTQRARYLLKLPTLFCDFCDRASVYELFTKEYVSRLAKYLNLQAALLQKKFNSSEPVTILEVGAGNGMLAYFIRNYLDPSRCSYIATDSNNWHISKQSSFVINNPDFHIMDYKQALEKFKPQIVVSSWMLKGATWDADFRKTESVQEYLLIGTPNGIVGHLWETWGCEHVEDFISKKLIRSPKVPYLKEGFKRKDLDFLSEHQLCFLDMPTHNQYSITVSFSRN